MPETSHCDNDRLAYADVTSFSQPLYKVCIRQIYSADYSDILLECGNVERARSQWSTLGLWTTYIRRRQTLLILPSHVA